MPVILLYTKTHMRASAAAVSVHHKQDVTRASLYSDVGTRKYFKSIIDNAAKREDNSPNLLSQSAADRNIAPM